MALRSSRRTSKVDHGVRASFGKLSCSVFCQICSANEMIKSSWFSSVCRCWKCFRKVLTLLSFWTKLPTRDFHLSRWPTASQVSHLPSFISFLSNVWEGGAIQNKMAIWAIEDGISKIDESCYDTSCLRLQTFPDHINPYQLYQENSIIH